MVTKRLLLLAAVLGMAGCALDSQGAPPLAGPSELGLSITVTASPDIITQDGASQALIEVIARDQFSQPVRGLTLRADITVNGGVVDFGALSSKTISTDAEGRARMTYFSPGAPPPAAAGDNVVEILVTPVSGNYANSVPRGVQILLKRPGVILPPNGRPQVSFFFSPTTPKQEEDVLFDASASTDDDGVIVSYSWNFGDGDLRTTSGPRISHSYELPGTYHVVLTVTDDRGQTSSSAPTSLTVGAATLPTASFTFSPIDPKKNTIVFFNALQSTAALGRSIRSYEWDFGDGTTGEGATPQHVYTQEATFTVTLVVTDNLGSKHAVAKTLTICPAAGCVAEEEEDE